MKIAVAGLGTVGSGVLRILQQNGALLEQRCGRAVQLTAVSALDRPADSEISLGDAVWFDDAVAMAREADAEVVVELIGGSEGVAKAVCEAAIGAGRHVVTANKALIAMHGTAIARAAEGAGVGLGYEAAVAGGIPIIKALREGLSGNRIEWLTGITPDPSLSHTLQSGMATIPEDRVAPLCEVYHPKKITLAALEQ